MVRPPVMHQTGCCDQNTSERARHPNTAFPTQSRRAEDLTIGAADHFMNTLDESPPSDGRSMRPRISSSGHQHTIDPHISQVRFENSHPSGHTLSSLIGHTLSLPSGHTLFLAHWPHTLTAHWPHTSLRTSPQSPGLKKGMIHAMIWIDHEPIMRQIR